MVSLGLLIASKYYFVKGEWFKAVKAGIVSVKEFVKYVNDFDKLLTEVEEVQQEAFIQLPLGRFFTEKDKRAVIRSFCERLICDMNYKYPASDNMPKVVVKEIKD